jgi:hypothetical protein
MIEETYARMLKHDGSVDAVYTHRTQADTIAGTVWRFILDYNQTRVVVPYQLPDAPAKALHCVPERIESVLGGPRGLGDFGFAVVHAAEAALEFECNWQAETDAVVEAELQKWQARRKWPALEHYDHDCKKANQERVQKWQAAGLAGDAPGNKSEKKKWITGRQAISREVCARFNLAYENESGKHVKPDRIKDVEREREAIQAQRVKIETRHQKRIEREKAHRVAEIEKETQAELGRALSAYGVKRPGRAKLKALCDFIRKDLFPQSPGQRPIIRDTSLRRVLERVEQLTGVNILESVFVDYSPAMKSHVEQLAKERAEAEATDVGEARRRVLEQVRFVAVFGDGKYWFVESLTRDVHDKEDAELFRLVAPSEAARAENQTRLEAAREESLIQWKTERKKEYEAIGSNHIFDPEGRGIFRSLAPGFARVEFRGIEYSCSPKGGKIVEVCVRDYAQFHYTQFPWDYILSKIGKGGESLTDAFHDYKPTLKALFCPVRGSRGLYGFMPAVIANGGEISALIPA